MKWCHFSDRASSHVSLTSTYHRNNIQPEPTSQTTLHTQETQTEHINIIDTNNLDTQNITDHHTPLFNDSSIPSSGHVPAPIPREVHPTTQTLPSTNIPILQQKKKTAKPTKKRPYVHRVAAPD
eukprot:GHVR01137678.1.p2 GENE.GHVR01137678.1~~GHVR01137678.1.p2  ORF type:complete len:124 (-),score=24.89 GHVR01137678.1:2477-2848(-)